MKKDLLFSQSEEAPEGQIHFIASSDFQNIDFFKNITGRYSDYDFSNLEVYINGKLTDQVANSISASANDDIIIKATRGVYPWFGYYINLIDYIKSIEEPFPLMYQADGSPIDSFGRCFDYCYTLTSIPVGLFDNNPQVTNFYSCFSSCSSLTNIPAGLFDNNPQVTTFNSCFYGCSSLSSIPTGLFDKNNQVTDFSDCFNRCSSLTNIPAGLFNNNTLVTASYRCFYNCSSLTSIPEGLFDKNTLVTSFRECFYGCSSLTSIPEGLFDKNTLVNNFNSCFRGCSNLVVIVQIGSTASSINRNFASNFANNTKEKGTVYCKAGSAAYTAFAESSNANVNVLTY